MGREIVAVCQWDGQTAEVKLHLDSRFLQLRGDLRADIPRAAILGAVLVEDGLEVTTEGGTLAIALPGLDAERWRKALLKQPPTLAEKLGVGAEAPAFVLGAFEDDPLSKALVGATVAAPADAAILVAVLLEPAQLVAASDLAQLYPSTHIWMVHEKGKAAGVSDAMVRTHMRALGFIDSKTSAVSDKLTATRYRLR